MIFWYLKILFFQVSHLVTLWNIFQKEEIILAIYNMASVSFEAFFDNFLVEYLEKITSLDQNQKTILKTAFKMDVVGLDFFQTW